MTERSRMHGLTVASDLQLHGLPAAGGEDPDLGFFAGEERLVPEGTPDGVVLASVPRADRDGPFMTLVRRPSGCWTIRCHGLCDIELSAGLETAWFHRDPRAPEGADAVLASGLVIAIVCMLRGHLVLHASAVDHGGGAVGMTGRSGMGKSTVAWLLCAAGARLVSDDVLRVDDPGGVPLCWFGTSENRLRPSAAQSLGPGSFVSRQTADGRCAVSLPCSSLERLPLRGLVVPYPDKAAKRVELELAPASDALILLSAFARVPGVVDPVVRAQQFAMTAQLVRTIPVFVATLPWGPPFRPSLGSELLERVFAEV